MITAIKINRVEARRNKEEEVVGLNINIGIESLSVKNNMVEIGFTYAASYMDGVGELKMDGVVYASEDAKLAKEINDRWVKERRLPDSYAELILNAINYACGTNGTLVVRAVNLSPPIMPPKIQLSPTPPSPQQKKT
ncbi:MAG: hypothetical protein N3G80_04255 [Candidatus Micrarchaeota archaeon]|nr:hypothetical protein [Candidatus Micrarchaeota archaeon]